MSKTYAILFDRLKELLNEVPEANKSSVEHVIMIAETIYTDSLNATHRLVHIHGLNED